ncbi:hypothetical protein ACWDKQ_09670 [Saccharopolyspora sp. NPDC000995]
MPSDRQEPECPGGLGLGLGDEGAAGVFGIGGDHLALQRFSSQPGQEIPGRGVFTTINRGLANNLAVGVHRCRHVRLRHLFLPGDRGPHRPAIDGDP